jgi:hypothetical protein
MGNASGAGVGAIIISVLLSAMVTAAGMYFGLPYIFPNVQGDQEIVLQEKYLELDSIAYISGDTDVWNYNLIPQTQFQITTHGNSKIAARFSATAFVTVSDDFINHTIFDFLLSVDDIKEQRTSVWYFRQLAETYYIQFTQQVYLELLTEILPAGTYTVSVYWRSRWNPTGTVTQCSLGHSNVANFTRVLVAEELRSCPQLKII